MTDRLDRLEALAAYAAGELDDAERREIEALMASDPAAAADLERLADLDDRLTAAPALELPTGAHDRLLAALGPIVEEELGPEPGTRASRVRAMFGWLVEGGLVPRLAAGAAALVVIAGVGIGLSQIGGTGGGLAALSPTAGEQLASPGVAGDAAMDTFGRDGGLLAGGVYDEATALALLDSYADRLAAPEVAPGTETSDGTAAGATDDGGAEADMQSLFAAIDRCASKPLESGPGEQLHGELATYNDEPAIVFVIERPDASLELWVLEQSDCGILLFHKAE
ncbi:MAG TPA: hypothetical protein VGA36_11950 [Nitriliruptorales bacterium]